MNMDELKKRKTPRYQSFDYNSSGVYFITICTQNRRCILSRIVGTGVLDCPLARKFDAQKANNNTLKVCRAFFIGPNILLRFIPNDILFVLPCNRHTLFNALPHRIIYYFIILGATE